MGYINQQVVDFYNSIDSIKDLIDSETYKNSEDNIQFLLLINYKDYLGIENIDSFRYSKEMLRLISLGKRNNIENEIKNNLFTIDDKIVILKKHKANCILEKANSKLERKSRHPKLNENDLVIEYLDAKINYLETLKSEETEDLKEQPKPLVIGIKDVKVPHKLVLLYELGIYQLLNERIIKNSGSMKDLAKIIHYVIDEENEDYIYSLLSIRDLNPLTAQYNDPTRDNPFTGPSIKKMKEIIADCNIQIEREYPAKAPSRNIKHKKK